MTDLIEWEQDKALYLFTSLTAGSSHVITATSRIETILKSARIPFSYIDTATNEGAKKLYQRRGKGKKLPLLVKEGFVVGDLEQIEEWNEFGELQEAIGPVATTATSHVTTPAKPPNQHGSAASTTSPPAAATTSRSGTGLEAPLAASSLAPSVSDALRKAAFESASAAKDRKVSGAGTSSSTGIVPTAALKSPSDTVPPPPAPTPVHGTASAKAGPAATAIKARSSLGQGHSSDDTADNVTTQAASSGTSGTAAGEGAAGASPPSRVTSATSSRSASATTQQQQYVPDHFDPPVTMHRGSSMSLASQEEIREIESRETIQEEDGEEEEEASAPAVAVQQQEKSPKHGQHDTAAVIGAEPKSKVEQVKQVVAKDDLSTKDKVVEAAKAVVGSKDSSKAHSQNN